MEARGGLSDQMVSAACKEGDPITKVTVWLLHGLRVLMVDVPAATEERAP